MGGELRIEVFFDEGRGSSCASAEINVGVTCHIVCEGSVEGASDELGW